MFIRHDDLLVMVLHACERLQQDGKDPTAMCYLLRELDNTRERDEAEDAKVRQSMAQRNGPEIESTPDWHQ